LKENYHRLSCQIKAFGDFCVDLNHTKR